METNEAPAPGNATQEPKPQDEPLRPFPIALIHVFMFAFMYAFVWVYFPLIIAAIPIFIDQGWSFTHRGEQRLESIWTFTFGTWASAGIAFGTGAALYIAWAAVKSRPVEQKRLAQFAGFSGLLLIVPISIVGAFESGSALNGISIIVLFCLVYGIVLIPSIVLILVAESISDKLCGRTEKSCVRAAAVLSITSILYLGTYAHLRQADHLQLHSRPDFNRTAIGSYAEHFIWDIDADSFWVERLFWIPGIIESNFTTTPRIMRTMDDV